MKAYCCWVSSSPSVVHPGHQHGGAPNAIVSCLSTTQLKTVLQRQTSWGLFFHCQKKRRDLHGGQMRAQSTPMPSSPLAFIFSSLREIIWNSAVVLHFAFLQLGGTRLGAQQCRMSHAHMTEIGRDTNKTSRAFSDHPVIQYKNQRKQFHLTRAGH